MNSPNHVLIGCVIYEYLREKYGITLKKSSFLKGNTCPDHGISFFRPHRMKYCSRMVQKKTAKLFGGGRPINRRNSKRIGILCHYYSDFFCCAHDPRFSGSLREHRRYENRLLCFMSEHYDAFRRIDYVPDAVKPETAREISARMNLLLCGRPTAEGDYEAELFCAIRACSELVLSLTAAFSRSKAVPGPTQA